MKEVNGKKVYSLDEMLDKHIGELGTNERNNYESELRLDLLGEMIKRVRKEQNLTQEELGALIGVKKSQISKIEKSGKNVTIDTLIRVFDALKAQVKIKVEFNNSDDLIIA
jgi:HTH-type transcriptional regulator/antitoxin HipB